jgi:predicted secreted protein
VTEKVLDHLRNNESLSLGVGESFLVRLPEVPTTGYRWIVEVLPEKAVELIEDSFDQHENSLTGGGGSRLFRLVAAKNGKAILSLFLCREWEKKINCVDEHHYELFIS